MNQCLSKAHVGRWGEWDFIWCVPDSQRCDEPHPALVRPPPSIVTFSTPAAVVMTWMIVLFFFRRQRRARQASRNCHKALVRRRVVSSLPKHNTFYGMITRALSALSSSCHHCHYAAVTNLLVRARLRGGGGRGCGGCNGVRGEGNNLI